MDRAAPRSVSVISMGSSVSFPGPSEHVDDGSRASPSALDVDGVSVADVLVEVRDAESFYSNPATPTPHTPTFTVDQSSPASMFASIAPGATEVAAEAAAPAPPPAASPVPPPVPPHTTTSTGIRRRVRAASPRAARAPRAPSGDGQLAVQQPLLRRFIQFLSSLFHRAVRALFHGIESVRAWYANVLGPLVSRWTQTAVAESLRAPRLA